MSVAIIVQWLLLNNTFSFSLCCALQYKESISISVNCNTDFLESVFILTLWIQKTQGLIVFLNWDSMVLDCNSDFVTNSYGESSLIL